MTHYLAVVRLAAVFLFFVDLIDDCAEVINVIVVTRVDIMDIILLYKLLTCS